MHTSEYSLIQNIAAGDQQALRQFYVLYQARVYNTCLSMLRQEQEAEEAAQDVFLEIHASAYAFKENSSVSTWVYRIAVNKCLDRLRHRNRKKRFALLTSIFHRETGEIEHDAPDFDHPGVILENREKAAILFKALALIPENQQTAFVLKQVEGLSQKEISAIMQIGEKAVESLLSRAKTNLRKLLSDFYDKNEGNF